MEILLYPTIMTPVQNLPDFGISNAYTMVLLTDYGVLMFVIAVRSSRIEPVPVGFRANISSILYHCVTCEVVRGSLWQGGFNIVVAKVFRIQDVGKQKRGILGQQRCWKPKRWRHV
jgi:hypothetical protein